MRYLIGTIAISAMLFLATAYTAIAQSTIRISEPEAVAGNSPSIAKKNVQIQGITAKTTAQPVLPRATTKSVLKTPLSPSGVVSGNVKSTTETAVKPAGWVAKVTGWIKNKFKLIGQKSKTEKPALDTLEKEQGTGMANNADVNKKLEELLTLKEGCVVGATVKCEEYISKYDDLAAASSSQPDLAYELHDLKYERLKIQKIYNTQKMWWYYMLAL